MSKESLTEELKPAFFPHRENSPTAATVGDDRYKPTEGQVYRVMLQTGMGLHPVDVEALTGDEAATKAQAQYLGSKVAHVAPAPKN